MRLWAAFVGLVMGSAAWADEGVGVCGYKAVLFGAQNYGHDSITDLATPNRDIDEIAGVLRDQYGFAAETFPDATRQQILDRLEALQRDVRDCEAVLVYYGGHGELDPALDEGFWLPVDARGDSKANWISNDDVASRLRALPARHVLLVADSCFAGKLFRGLETIASPLGNGAQDRATRLAAKQSRMVLTSGGEEPVEDSYLDSGMSVFAYFLRQSLAGAPQRYVTADQWFSALRERVMDNARQQPQLGRLFGTGHEGGSLVMVNQEGEASAVVHSGGVVADGPRPRRDEPAPPPPGTDIDQDGIEWVEVPGGAFRMGAASGDPDARVDERPARQMTVAARWVMRREVSQAQWTTVMGTSPSTHADCGPDCPVDSVSWFDAVRFANALSERHGRKPVYTIKGSKVRWRPRRNGYRLLTEAEWEHAATGGKRHPFSGDTDPTAVAWISDNAAERPHPTCTRAPNAWGLCDMSGNVLEWVWDWYDPDTYVAVAADQARGPEAGTLRVMRGGSFALGTAEARVVRRFGGEPDAPREDVGFRLVRPD